MNKGVEQLAARFKTTSDVIEAGLKAEGNLDSVFEAYDKGVQIFTHDELTKKLENHATEAIELLGADGKQIPSKIYNLAKGNAFEKLEKTWAKKHGISAWEGIDDLQEKIIGQVEAKSGKADDEKDSEIKRLKKLVLDTDKERDEAVSTATKDFNGQLAQRDVESVLGRINIDETGEKLDNQRAILKAVVKGELTFEYINGITVAFKNGEMLKDKVGDPQSLEGVLVPFAEKYVNVKSVPEGGRGGDSTEDTKTGVKAIKTKADFYAHAESQGIEEGTAAYFDLMQEFNEIHPEINI